jgi:hypothetical protein
MVLKTELALADLAAALAGVAGLPATIVHNDMRLQDFVVSSDPTIAHKLVLFDEAPRILNTMLGDPVQYELSLPVTVAYLVQGEAGAARDAVWATGIEALAAVLFPDGAGRRVDGLIDDMTIGDMDRAHRLEDAGVPPIEQFEVTLLLHVTALTPFG